MSASAATRGSARLAVIAMGGAFAISCAGATPRASSRSASRNAEDSRAVSPWTDDAARGVEDRELAQLLLDHWENAMRTSPEWATQLGDHRFDDQLTDYSPAAYEARRSRRRRFIARAEAIDPSRLTSSDRVTRTLFLDELRDFDGLAICRFERWNVSSRVNPLGELNRLSDLGSIRTQPDREHLLARYHAVPRAVRDMGENLTLGARDGQRTNRRTVLRVIEMFEAQLAAPIDEWALLALEASPTFRARLRAIVEEEIRPAFQAFLALLRETILPGARDGDRVGVSALGPDGPACYAASIRSHTSRAASAEALHRLGLEEVERVNGEMQQLGMRLFHTEGLQDILTRLRTDRSLYFSSQDEVEAAAQHALDAAQARVPQYFGALPETPCVVTRIPEYEAPFTSVGYYRPPRDRGRAPGEFYINTSSPETRPRFEAEVLAYHEAVPGHHLQIALSHELEAVPLFRRHAYVTVYVEGWALYSERLADEMGLYSSDLDRMGMLSYDAWRASRLVVDTGIHAMGWDRDRAEQFMLRHTALTPTNIANEVDRYIVWPGQALAYKVGQLEIRRMRQLAETELGNRFVLAEFHDVILRAGGVSMEILEAMVRAWIASRLRGAP